MSERNDARSRWMAFKPDTAIVEWGMSEYALAESRARKHIAEIGTKLEQERAKITALVEALNGITEKYVALAESGDCGFWDPEKKPEVIAARAALALAGATP